MPKGLHSFIDRTRYEFRQQRLPGYPTKVPGHLLLADILARPDPQDLETAIGIFGLTQVRSMLSQMVEKGRISPTAVKEVEVHLPEDQIFRTL